MNEKAKTLLDTAYSIFQKDTRNLTMSDIFAELIVRECLDQCYNRGMNDELYAGQLRAAEYIEQHFGVEE